MDAIVSLNRVAELTDSERAALRALSLAVYPPHFTFNRVLTCDVRLAGPVAGTIDLGGPPW
jgi:hypothetical protein